MNALREARRIIDGLLVREWNLAPTGTGARTTPLFSVYDRMNDTHVPAAHPDRMVPAWWLFDE
jgi:hypothetical protein